MHASLQGFHTPEEEQVVRAADSLRLLADPTRLKIVWALHQGESSVTCLAELVGASPAAVSQHLAKLRLAKLVRARREGAFVFYEIVDEGAARLVEHALFPSPERDTAAVSSE